MTQPRKYTKRPVEVEALQWTGTDGADLYNFTNGNFNVLEDEDRERSDDPEATAEVFDKLHATWVLVYDGDYIIRGVKGEFYPCRPDVFEQTYEPAKENDE